MEMPRKSFIAVLLVLVLGFGSFLLMQAPILGAVDAADTDGDGLTDLTEQVLGTNVFSIDTDCDTYADGEEVGDPIDPIDTDGDGLIDARENNLSGDNTNADSFRHATCFRFSPFVIANDGVDSSLISVRIEAPEPVDSVIVPIEDRYSLVWAILLDGVPLAPGENISLFDDGTHGDFQAGDRVWSRNGFTVKVGPPLLGERDLWMMHLRTVRALDVQGGTLFQQWYGPPDGFHGGAELGIVSHLAIKEPQTPTPDVQIVAHVAAIVDPETNLLMGRRNGDGTVAGNTIYQHFPDDYDFVVLYEDYNRLATGPSGFARAISNNVAGIGDHLHDESRFYGSAGKLQEITQIAFSTGGPMDHEFMHRWAAPNLSTLGLNQCTGNPPSSHWGVAGVGKGILGGYDPATLVVDTNGTYSVGSFGPSANYVLQFNQLELYLAGMIPASQVQPIQVPINVDCSSLVRDESNTVTFKASGTQTVTIDQIQAALGGPRNPSFEQAPKNFTVGSFVIAPRLLTPAELAFFSVRSESISRDNEPESPNRSFAQLTLGAGTMSTSMVDVTTDGVDTWVDVPSVVPTIPSDLASIQIQYGNAGGSNAGATTLVLTFDSTLVYLDDTIGVTPTVAVQGSITTARWEWPTMSSIAKRTGAVSVSVPDAPIGTTYAYTVTIEALTEALPANNSGSGQVMVSGFVFLPNVQQ